MIALIITHILILIAGMSIGISYKNYHDTDIKQFYKGLKKKAKYIWKHRKEIISNE